MTQPSSICKSGEFENPLLWPILEILRGQPKAWKVHILARELVEQGYIQQLDLSSEKDLFKRNFLIMNALYQLQETVYPEQWLCVDAMNIMLTQSTSLPRHDIDISDPLREYYLDWRHYEADDDEVRRLLNQFWQTYQRYIGGNIVTRMDKAKALSLFELDSSATHGEIRKQWRKLAFRWHPDREHGNAGRFRVLCEAWNVLRTEK